MVENIRKHLPSHLGTNLVTLIASYFLFVSTMSGNENELLKTAFAQIEKQSEEIVELRALLLQSQLRIVELETAVRQNVSRTQLLNEYLNSLPFPAWIKEYDKDTRQLTMYLLNDAYTAEYGYTRNEYVGKTDYEVHSNTEAERYEDHDLQVIDSGKSIRVKETVVLARGGEIDLVVYKFPINIGGTRRGVGGVAIRGDFATFDLKSEVDKIKDLK